MVHHSAVVRIRDNERKHPRRDGDLLGPQEAMAAVTTISASKRENRAFRPLLTLGISMPFLQAEIYLSCTSAAWLQTLR